jgi:hypothetical protein
MIMKLAMCIYLMIMNQFLVSWFEGGTNSELQNANEHSNLFIYLFIAIDSVSSIYKDGACTCDECNSQTDITKRH